ncbi:hypothetical protein F-LCD7_0376 [Faustovirus]|nr:hypothetical protein F-LCD7_0376 [Faustovirus]
MNKCNACRNIYTNDQNMRKYRDAKWQHYRAANIYTLCADMMAGIGLGNIFMRTIDSHWLPERMRVNGSINDRQAVLMELLSERRANKITAAIFGTAAIFWCRAWYHRNQYNDYKTKLRRLKNK